MGHPSRHQRRFLCRRRAARARLRTFFAVGDEKQSIYSFQGARPDMFAAMKSHFGRSVADAEQRFEDVDLLLSFRSAKAILDAVDRCVRASAERAAA